MQKKKLDISKIKILVCCHKPSILPDNPDDIFLPIQVGAAISSVNLGFQSDDKIQGADCENISKKNKNYCELTALYWAWKNIQKIYPNIEYIGLNHYRRFFNFKKKNGFLDRYTYLEKEISTYELDTKKINKILNKNSVILAKKRKYPYSLETDYAYCHVSDDIKTLRLIILEKFPEYLSSFDDFIVNNNGLNHYNMFIMPIKDFYEYCSWLFCILEEIEHRIDISNYSDVQKRIYGYMAERLLGVWMLKNKKNVIYYPVNWYTDDVKDNKRKYFFSQLRKDRAFKVSLSLRTRIIYFLNKFLIGQKLLSAYRKKK